MTRHRVRCLHAVTTTLSRTHTHCRRVNEPRPTNRPPLPVSLSVRRPKVLSPATEITVNWPSNAPFRGLHASLDSTNGKPFLSSWAPITQGDAHPRDSLPEIRLRRPSRKRVEPSKTVVSTRLEIDNVECSPDDSPRNKCARRSPKGPSFSSAPRGWGTRGEDHLILTGCQLFASVTEITSFEPGRPIGSSTNTGSENFIVWFIPRVTSEEATRRIHPTPFSSLFLNPLRTRGGRTRSHATNTSHFAMNCVACGFRLLRWQVDLTVRRLLFAPCIYLPRHSASEPVAIHLLAKVSRTHSSTDAHSTHRGHHRMKASLPDTPRPVQNLFRRSERHSSHGPQCAVMSRKPSHSDPTAR